MIFRRTKREDVEATVTYGKRPMWVRDDGKAYPFMVPTIEPLTYTSPKTPITYPPPPKPQRTRTVADVEAEIRRATIPGMRAEDV